jgi:4-coumarate--CoA ligase
LLTTLAGFKDATRGVGDKVLAILPFFHIYGLTAMMINPIYTGILTVVGAAFDLRRWCNWVQEHQITIGYVVPPIVVQLSKDPIVANYDLSSLRVTTCGAAPLSKQLVEAVYDRLGLRIKQGYGMSETAPTLFTMRWCDWNKKSGSAGWLIPNVQAKMCSIKDDATSNEPVMDLEPGSAGELYVKGPNVFKGYWKREQATRESFVDGWFRTGDIGYVDDDGDLFITDRAKELIKYKGFQVAPAELEGLLLQNELIQDAAVVGINKSELGTEVPRAYVVRRGGLAVREGDAAGIMKWLESRVVPYKRLRGGICFVDEIPRNGSGKILRRILKDQANRGLQTKL